MSVSRMCRSEQVKKIEKDPFICLANPKNARVPINSSAVSSSLLTATVAYAQAGNPASHSPAIVSNLSERRVTRPDMQ